MTLVLLKAYFSVLFASSSTCSLTVEIVPNIQSIHPLHLQDFISQFWLTLRFPLLVLIPKLHLHAVYFLTLFCIMFSSPVMLSPYPKFYLVSAKTNTGLYMEPFQIIPAHTHTSLLCTHKISCLYHSFGQLTLLPSGAHVLFTHWPLSFLFTRFHTPLMNIYGYFQIHLYNTFYIRTRYFWLMAP